MSEWILLGIGLLLTIGTGLFVASEFALVNLDRADLEARRDRGETRLGLTISALKITSTHLSSAQLGITLTTLLTGYTMEPAISSLLAEPLAAIGVPEGLVRPVGAISAIVIATLLSMVIGELVPKNFALALPIATAKLALPFQTAFTWVFRPAVVLLNGSANTLLRAIGIEPKEELSGARSAEELSSLVRRSASAGLLEQDTATLLGRTLRFADHDASDVMTPRPSVAAVQRLEPAEAVLELARQTGYSRFPVFDENLDDVVGIVHVKQAVAVPRDRRADVPASALQSEALRVPETIKLDALLSELRGRGFQMAVVVDEYGGTSGIVTLEDVVEEIVGEVSDEHDRSRQGGRELIDGSWTVPGLWRPDEVRDAFDADVPDGSDYETMGGFVMTSLGRVPVVGDVVQLPGWRIKVVGMEGRRVDRLRFLPDPGSLPHDGPDEGPTGARTGARAGAPTTGAALGADHGRMPSGGGTGDRP